MNTRFFQQALCFVFASFFVLAVNAQNSLRTFESYNFKDGNILEVKTNQGTYHFRFYDKNIIETAFVPKGETILQNSTAIAMQPERVAAKLRNKKNCLHWQSKGISLTITKKPFCISYAYKKRPLIAEKEGFVQTDSTRNIDFKISANEALFGGGERVLGMNRRGNRLQLYNRAHYGYETHAPLMNYCMPLVISSKIYGIHFDNAPIGFLDLDSKKNNTLRYETISGRAVYQIIAGDSWQDYMREFTKLTGRQPMLPRWALGNFSSRFGYHSQKEVENTIATFQKDSIPVDALILDLYWFGKTIKNEMGNLAFDLDSFPHPHQMISALKRKGVKTVLVTEPFILTTSKRWQEAVDKRVLATDSLGKPFTYDFYFGHTGLVDIFKPEAKHWFWNIYKNLAKEGVAGWWGDLGEPEVHPSALRHVNGTADEVHNIYGHTWAKMLFESYCKEFPNTRPFILMRSGAVGSQRYGMVPWSGDVNRTWGGLKGQVEISTQMGMQGIPLMHSDLGGFAGDNLNDELYERWLQYGIFQPIFRPHAQETVASEPIFRTKRTKNLAKQAINLRYQLLPYNYTLLFENHSTGMPLMRPLFFENTANTHWESASKTYFWGDAFFVSPITDEGEKQQTLTMPQSTNWYDFFTDKKYIGGQTYIISTTENHIPVFVKGGAFIPMIDVIQNTENYSIHNLKVHFYTDIATPKSKGVVYNDDGETPQAFEKGMYEKLLFSAKTTRSKIAIKITSEIGTNFSAKEKKLHWTIHNISKKPKFVKIGKEKIAFQWNKEVKTLSFQVTIQSVTKNIFIKR